MLAFNFLTNIYIEQFLHAIMKKHKSILIYQHTTWTIFFKPTIEMHWM